MAARVLSTGTVETTRVRGSADGSARIHVQLTRGSWPSHSELIEEFGGPGSSGVVHSQDDRAAIVVINPQ